MKIENKTPKFLNSLTAQIKKAKKQYEHVSNIIHHTHFNLSFLRRNIKGMIGAILPITQTGKIDVMGKPIQTLIDVNARKLI